MELNKVVQALKTLRDEGREDLIKEGVLVEAWVGLKRPKRLSVQGVSAAVAACSSPSGKPKKCKTKSAEGRKVMRSPVQLQEVLESVPGSAEVGVPHRRGTGHLLRRSGVSLARRVATGGRGVVRLGAVARGGRQGARLGSARVTCNVRGGRALKQVQLLRDNAAERKAAILEERSLGGINKMAASMGKDISAASLSSKGRLAEGQRLAEGREQEEEVIVISDEEQEGQESFGFVESVIDVPAVSYLGKGAGVDGLRESSFERCLSVRSIDGNVGAQNVLHMGEQVDLVNQDDVMVKGLDAGRHAGGQSFPVKARAPLAHRKEGRVNSGAAYPTTSEAVARCSLGHSAGSVLEDEQPSTSWGAGARFERQDETLLDYDEDDEDQDAMVAAPVLPSTVPEVVQGDRSGNRCRATAGNLRRGEIGMEMGRIVGGNYQRDGCGSGGVDASVQVDYITDNGAGKSEVMGDVRKEDESKVLQESVKKGGVVGADVSVKGCVGDPDGVCTVWIVGHSFTRWAEKQAATRHFGRQLGLDGVRIKVSWVVIHLGENDLVSLSDIGLLKAKKMDLLRIKEKWSVTHIVWTGLVPQRSQAIIHTHTHCDWDAVTSVSPALPTSHVTITTTHDVGGGGPGSGDREKGAESRRSDEKERSGEREQSMEKGQSEECGAEREARRGARREGLDNRLENCQK
ncbi:hypothetical protein NDU88_005766 [Pleurodeles waltl]|uniref:Uncharacterized protein n=1 Tax=Pleurodeles waltl TaxID=8319 RepID=A0AAV7X0I0_PLEWA|nr:hypothetical protein NDU88_005766 [Pleurodeles waltl]